MNTMRRLFEYVCVSFFFLSFSKKKKKRRRFDVAITRGCIGYYRASRGAEKRIRGNITHCDAASREGKEEGGGSNGSTKNTLHTQ